ncbi:hypothetical protein Tco_1221392 [Tanacetum coccineum]
MLVNHCLTERLLLAVDKTQHPVVQNAVREIVTQTNIIMQSLIWKSLVKGSRPFFSHKASHKAKTENPKIETQQESIPQREDDDPDLKLAKIEFGNPSEKREGVVSIPVSDPVKAHEAQAGPDPEAHARRPDWTDYVKLHVSHYWSSNPSDMDDEFLATTYQRSHCLHQSTRKLQQSHTSLPKNHSIIALQYEWQDWTRDCLSERKTDHSFDVLSSSNPIPTTGDII